jgi:hypothetical protein
MIWRRKRRSQRKKRIHSKNMKIGLSRMRKVPRKRQ